jgi:flavin reductase (DIM6/NTAB) family NADH-FMN oxidoreductase RutF
LQAVLSRRRLYEPLWQHGLDTQLPRLYDENTIVNQKMTIDAEQLRAAMRAWTSGVTIVTATYSGEKHGMTVSSFTSISLDPPLIVISLQTISRTHELVSRAQAFGVTILASDQQGLSERFASSPLNMGDRLEGLQTETLVSGAPFIKGGLTYLDCRVTQTVLAGMNTLFIAEVIAVRGNDHAAPLIYHDRNYHGLQ